MKAEASRTMGDQKREVRLWALYAVKPTYPPTQTTMKTMDFRKNQPHPLLGFSPYFSIGLPSGFLPLAGRLGLIEYKFLDEMVMISWLSASGCSRQGYSGG